MDKLKCDKCNLRFDNPYEYSNHLKNFCNDDFFNKTKQNFKTYLNPYLQNNLLNSNKYDYLDKKINDDEERLKKLRESHWNNSKNYNLKDSYYITNELDKKNYYDYLNNKEKIKKEKEKEYTKSLRTNRIKNRNYDDSLKNLLEEKLDGNKLMRKELEDIKLRKTLKSQAEFNNLNNKINNLNDSMMQLSKNYESQKNFHRENILNNNNNDLGNYFKSPFQDFLPNNMASNKTRNPDMNFHERIIGFLINQELDDLRMFEKIPNGTELYRFKLEQLKEVSTTRAETQKILHEQILKEFKRRYDLIAEDQDNKFDNEIWVDEWRKRIIAQRIKKDLRPQPYVKFEGDFVKQKRKKYEEDLNEVEKDIVEDNLELFKNYDPEEGLKVYWDYQLGIDNQNGKNNDKESLQFIFTVVCEGEVLIDAQLVDLKKFENEGVDKLLSLILDESIIKGIGPNPETLLIWEVQLVEKNGNVESLGWTQMDLFELSRELRRGIWKCPLYKPPVDYNITKFGVLELLPNYGMWFYLRIGFPWKDQFTYPFDINYKINSGKYSIPEMHLRVANYIPKITRPIIEMKKPKMPEIYIPNFKKDESEDEKESFDGSIPYQVPEGIRVVLHKIKNHISASHFKVTVAVFEANNLISDDLGNLCKKSSTIHNPLDVDDDNINILVNRSIMENKAEGSDIVFGNEQFIFWANFPIMYQKDKKELYLAFQLFEKPEPKNILNSSKVGYSKVGEDNYGGQEYKLVGYTYFKFMNKKGEIINSEDENKKYNAKDFLRGKEVFRKKVYLPPAVPPEVFDPKERPEKNTEIEFSFFIHRYYRKDLEREYLKYQKINKIKEKEKKKVVEKEGAAIIDNRPYIPNQKIQYTDSIFRKGYGVDIFIDGARFLPDNITVTKCIIRVVNSNLVDQFRPVACLPKFNKSTYSPIFEFRHEYRAEFFDPTCLLFITLITVDKSNNETRIIGYSAINWFINRYTKQQPDNQNDPDIILYNGNYEIPIINEEPLRSSPFNLEVLSKYKKLPLASLLIRIRKGILSDDLKRVLSIKDIPKSQWKKSGIWPDRPLYCKKAYNNSLHLVKENERELYDFRLIRADPKLRETAYLLVRTNNINQDFTDRELFKWLDKNLSIDSSTKLIDEMYFAKYQKQIGFNFIIDGLNNVEESNVFVCFYSLNPPGSFYEEKKNPKNIILNSQINWDSPVGNVQYFNKFYNFKQVDFNPSLNIIIEVRKIVIQNQKIIIKEYGWSVVPIFNEDGYISGGYYQMPLFETPVNKTLIDELKTCEIPWKLVNNYITEKKISYKNKSSVFIRLLDGQNEGQLEDNFDIDSLNYKYLPQKKSELISFAYNKQIEEKYKSRTRLKKLIKNEDPLSYNNKLNKIFAENLGLEKYNFEN